MTKTKLPCCPETTAEAGTTSAFWSTYSRSRTLTNSPGQSAPSVFGKLPLSRIVPVVVSTALSTNASVPFARRSRRRSGAAITAIVVAPVPLDRAAGCRRHGEAHQDRLDLVDGHQRRRVGGAHQVALAHPQAAGAPRDRRADRGVLQVEPRLVHRRLARRERGAWRPPRSLCAASFCCAVTYSFSASVE